MMEDLLASMMHLQKQQQEQQQELLKQLPQQQEKQQQLMELCLKKSENITSSFLLDGILSTITGFS